MSKGIIATLGILFIVTSFIFWGYSAYAQSPLVFGGLIISSVPCPCSGSFLLTLSAPTPGQFVWHVGTPQYSNFQLPRAGVWTTGLYSPGGVCLAGSGCSPIGVPIGTILSIVGTSF